MTLGARSSTVGEYVCGRCGAESAGPPQWAAAGHDSGDDWCPGAAG